MVHRSSFCLTFFVVIILLMAVPLAVEGSNPPLEELPTAILASVLSPPVPVELTDRKLHLVYEVIVTNVSRDDWTLEKLNVFDVNDPGMPLASFAGEDLKAIMQVAGANEMATTLGPGQVGVIYLELTVRPERVPATLGHEFHTSSGVLRLLLVEVAGSPVVIGPPLSGDGWLAVNVLGNADHRRALGPINGVWYIAQRFAVDWMQIDAEGYMVHGDKTVNEDWVCYGADLLAVEDGTVLVAVDGLPDQTPDVMPTDLHFNEVGGNHIILDIGDGFYATYAHIQPGGLLVSEGDRVRRGQVIGKLGNSGNSSAPHLHFHVTKGLSPLFFGAQGVPFVFSAFEFRGLASTESMDHAFDEGLPIEIIPPEDAIGGRSGQMPAELSVAKYTP